ncbi:expressed unknown protein [Seminavis robusta]|uniref:Uncharacterized protein n=1 Tax=Seminavis robusta TaxID=568900 RepID=A0A9N8HF40_9STRA|nr:expressed unknown protein [Seminavis robusta]|eukprot:Sro414_g138390.1 n/a (129) ;mRNA; f:64194-64580
MCMEWVNNEECKKDFLPIRIGCTEGPAWVAEGDFTESADQFGAFFISLIKLTNRPGMKPYEESVPPLYQQFCFKPVVARIGKGYAEASYTEKTASEWLHLCRPVIEGVSNKWPPTEKVQMMMNEGTIG